MRRRLAFALRSEAPPPLALWLANEVDSGRMAPDAARDQLRTVDWDRVRDVDARIDAEEPNPVRRYGIATPCPTGSRTCS
jgi:hypothetical protein